MKAKNIFLSLAALAAGMVSCQEAAELQDVVLFTGTEQFASTTMTVDGPSSIALTVSSTKAMESATEVTVRTAPELVAEYNALNGTNYEPLPDNSYALDLTTLTIPARKAISNQTTLSVTTLDQFQEGTTYCMPVTITSVGNGMPVLESSRTIFVVVNRTIHTRAGKAASYSVPGFVGNADVSALPQVTMECRLNVAAFTSSSPYISTVMGLEENFLLRFGDVTIKPNEIQLAGGGYPVTGSVQFATNTWYHVAVVYNGEKITLFINGQEDQSTGAPRGTIDFSTSGERAFYIGESCNGRTLNGYVSEVRIWSKALSANDMKNNLCYVDPASEGLVAYWRFDSVNESGEVPDMTGHGYNAKPRRGGMTFMEDVRCPE